ncbi:hypothetical protein ACXZ1K_08280 [Pedobacter sp. PWIIR3]
MRKIIYLFILSLLFFGCAEKEIEKTYPTRMISQGETFNDYPAESDSTITFNPKNEKKGNQFGKNPRAWYQVKFGDTVVSIQTDKNNPSTVNGKFIRGKFMNTQKTCLLAQVADDSGLMAKFYLIALKNHQLRITELARPSETRGDKKYIGLTDLGSDGFLINNEFLIGFVNAKVHFLKRQNSDEPIQGQFIMKSPDHSTLVFLQQSSLYQINYPTDESLTVPLKVDATKGGLFIHIYENYVWRSKRPGIMFLMEDKNTLATN